jgi:uncharacterized membrane protein YqjE
MKEIRPDPNDGQLVNSSTVEVVREALTDARELVRLEVELAKNDVISEAKALARAGIGFGVAAVFSLVFLCLLAVALVLALGGTIGAAVGVAGACLLVGVAGAGVGYALLPKKPLDSTRHRLEADVRHMKGHVA